MKWSILLAMLFCHILDDFKLQNPVLRELKQRSWWEGQPDMKPKYQNDYKIALALHGMSWAFMVMLPIMVWKQFDVGVGFVLIWAIQATVHAAIDDTKTNQGRINLVQDQLLHLCQVASLWVTYVWCGR